MAATVSTATRDVSAARGAAIVAEAAKWKGTPYAAIGAASTINMHGDCSGSTWRIYLAAGLPYDYQMTSNFVSYTKMSGRFRELGPNESRQDGDILFWDGHMAVYSSFVNDPANAVGNGVVNDMWSAYHKGGPPYGAASSIYWRGGVRPRVFRYQMGTSR